MLFSIQILIQKVLKNYFFSFWQDFGFGECFLHEVIAEFVLPKKYLPELEKYILCIFLNILCMLFFSQFLNALKIVRFPIPYSKYPAVIIYIYSCTLQPLAGCCIYHIVPWSKVAILGMVIPPLIGILIMGI